MPTRIYSDATELDFTAEARVQPFSVALELDFTAEAKVQPFSVALELDYTAVAKVQPFSVALEIEYNPFFYPEAVVPGPAEGQKGTPHTFQGSGAGSIFRWGWTTAPASSLTAYNVPPTAMPDNGASSFISMASNAVLYHTNGDALDTSGNANPATLSNITYTADAQIGANAWSFDAPAAEATITTQVSLAGGEWSAAFWFKGLKADGSARSGFTNAARTDIPLRISSTNKLAVVQGGTQYLTTVEMLSADYTGWHHITVVGTGVYTTYYVDGVLVAMVQQKSTSNVKYIGNNSPSSQLFADKIDEVALWTRALTATEVNDIFVNQKGSYAYDAGTGYAGVAQDFTFTPDKGGDHIIQYTSLSPSLGGIATASATLSIPSGVGQGVIQGERPHRRTNLLGQRYKPWRGQKP